MTNEILANAIKTELDTIFADNAEMIAAELNACFKAGQPMETTAAKLAAKSMRLAAQTAVQYMIRLLEKEGLLELPADGTPILRPLDRQP